MFDWLKKKKPEESATDTTLGGYRTDGTPTALSSTGFFTSTDYDLLSNSFGYFTGSTIPGTLPLPRAWKLDYYALRERSWQAYTENEIAAAIIDRLAQFVVNSGLKLEYEPLAYLEKSLRIVIPDELKTKIESDFAMYASSRAADYSERKTLHQLAEEAYKNAQTAGDVLVVLHIKNGELKVQLIDGGNVISPTDRADLLSVAAKNNTISDGIEFDARQREVAFWVMEKNKFISEVFNGERDRVVRIPAYGRSGRRMAFMVSRSGHRPGSPRGKPRLTPVLEQLDIINRYKIAELMTAEAGATLLAQIEHSVDSTGANPLQSLPAGAGRKPVGQAAGLQLADVESGEKIAGQVRATTPAIAINMGRGQKLSVIDTKRPNIDGIKFIDAQLVHLCAAAGVPDEICKLLFGASYSAARAAFSMFTVVTNLERQFIMDEFYSVIARERQRLRTLQGKLEAPAGYKQAILDRDETLLTAYEHYRGEGIVMPHVDPVKEVNAAEKRLALRLTTHAKETEHFGTGEFYSNVESLMREEEAMKKLDETMEPDKGTEDLENKEAADAAQNEDKAQGQGEASKD